MTKIEINLSNVESVSNIIKAIQPFYIYAVKVEEYYPELKRDESVSSFEIYDPEGKIICITVGDLKRLIEAFVHKNDEGPNVQ